MSSSITTNADCGVPSRAPHVRTPQHPPLRSPVRVKFWGFVSSFFVGLCLLTGSVVLAHEAEPPRRIVKFQVDETSSALLMLYAIPKGERAEVMKMLHAGDKDGLAAHLVADSLSGVQLFRADEALVLDDLEWVVPQAETSDGPLELAAILTFAGGPGEYKLTLHPDAKHALSVEFLAGENVHVSSATGAPEADGFSAGPFLLSPGDEVFATFATAK